MVPDTYISLWYWCFLHMTDVCFHLPSFFFSFKTASPSVGISINNNMIKQLLFQLTSLVWLQPISWRVCNQSNVPRGLTHINITPKALTCPPSCPLIWQKGQRVSQKKRNKLPTALTKSCPFNVYPITIIKINALMRLTSCPLCTGKKFPI